MIIAEVGKTIERAYKKIDESWTKMLEDFAKNNKAAQDRVEKNPDILGNQTIAAVNRDRDDAVKGIPAPSETLASSVADHEHQGKWKKV